MFGNVDCAVAEAFYGACITNRNKVTVDIVRKDMPTAAAEHLGEIMIDKSIRPPHPGKGSEWIVFLDSGAEEQKAAVAGASTEPATRADVEV